MPSSFISPEIVFIIIRGLLPVVDAGGAFIQQYSNIYKLRKSMCQLFFGHPVNVCSVWDHVVLLTATAALMQEHLIKQVLIDT